MVRRSLLIAVLVVVGVAAASGIMLAGGWNGSSDDNTSTVVASETTQDRKNQSGEVLQRADISLNPEYNDSSELLTVGVVIKIKGYENLHYENVHLCAYTENGTVVDSAPITSIEPSQTEYQNINLSVKARPKYLTSYHPKFRNDSRIATEILKWVPERNWWRAQWGSLGEIQDDFEFPNLTEPGTCGR